MSIHKFKIIQKSASQTDVNRFHSSKGNQTKFYQNGWWVKLDQFGYEGLAETAVSLLLNETEKSDLFAADHIHYEPALAYWKGKSFRGCCSRNFLLEDKEIVTLEHLNRSYTGMGLATELANIAGTKEKIEFTVQRVITLTGLEHFGEYLTWLLEMDAFFYNEDRHTNNLAVLYNSTEDTFTYCPAFDMGLSMFSDTKLDYPAELSYTDCQKKITAKPFSVNFDKQMDAAEELYGYHLKFTFSRYDLEKRIAEFSRKVFGYDLYSPAELKRVYTVVRNQADKYRYMFR